MLDKIDLIINEALLDNQMDWQLHNCKIQQEEINIQKKQDFLYHYDRLSEEIKQEHPLTPDLLKQFATPMTAQQASELLGLTADILVEPFYIKFVGSVVIFSERLQIALRLHWTNTLKSAQAIYAPSLDLAKTQAAQACQWLLPVDILCKNNTINLWAYDENDEKIAIHAPRYTALPPAQALFLLHQLDRHKTQFDFVTQAIVDRIVAD